MEASAVNSVPVQPDVGICSAHATQVDALAAAFTTDLENGLTAEQSAEALNRFGANQLAEAPATPTWKKVLAQFRELVIWILISAAP